VDDWASVDTISNWGLIRNNPKSLSDGPETVVTAADDGSIGGWGLVQRERLPTDTVSMASEGSARDIAAWGLEARGTETLSTVPEPAGEAKMGVAWSTKGGEHLRKALEERFGGTKKDKEIPKDGEAVYNTISLKLKNFFKKTNKQPTEPKSPRTVPPKQPAVKGQAGKPDYRKYTKLKLLGRGAFGSVFLAKQNTTNKLFAVKRVDLNNAMSDNAAQEIANEISVMKKLNNQHIVRMYGSYVVKRGVEIYMEYVDGNSLDSQLKVFGPFPEIVIKYYTVQLLQALTYCHTLGVIHRDIKGKNILLMGTGMIKLADFGSAKLSDGMLKDEFTLNDSFKYTPQWVAPEVLGVTKWDAKVDIWSLGCVVQEMASARPPWHEKGLTNTFQIMYHISQTNEVPAIDDRLSYEGRDFVSRCFNRDPKKRPSARDLLTDQWVVEMWKSKVLARCHLFSQELASIIKGLSKCGHRYDVSSCLCCSLT